MLCKKHSRIFHILIALVFIYISFGYLLLFLPAKILIKEIVQYSIEKKEIKSEELSILVFNLTDLRNNKYDFTWEKKDKEFRFNGKMYDVEDRKIIGDSIYFTCYYDHKENILEELFAMFFANNKKDKTQNNFSRIVFFGFYSEEIIIPNNLPNNSYTCLPLNKKEDGIADHIKDILTPPPRITIPKIIS